MPTIVHFDVAADDPDRAKKFYEGLFGWKMENPPRMTDYYLIETEDLNGERGVGGGLGKRGEPGQRITSYIGVNSVDEYTAEVEKLESAVKSLEKGQEKAAVNKLNAFINQVEALSGKKIDSR